MQSRLDILKQFLKEANSSSAGDFSYSAIMRRIRKEHPDKVKDFMTAFKEAFDAGQMQEIDNLEQAALMQALKSIGLS